MSFKVTNFKEIECHGCYNHRTEKEFYSLNLGGLCQKCYDETMRKINEIEQVLKDK